MDGEGAFGGGPWGLGSLQIFLISKPIGRPAVQGLVKGVTSMKLETSNHKLVFAVESQIKDSLPAITVKGHVPFGQRLGKAQYRSVGGVAKDGPLGDWLPCLGSIELSGVAEGGDGRELAQSILVFERSLARFR